MTEEKYNQEEADIITLEFDDGAEAVSYTHLDVYKRQFYAGGDISCSNKQSC